MPKIRERARVGQDFSVTPWQSKRKDSVDTRESTLYVVTEANLLAPSATEVREPPQSIQRQSENHTAISDSSSWFVKSTRAEAQTPSSQPSRAAGAVQTSTGAAAGPPPLMQLYVESPISTSTFDPQKGLGIQQGDLPGHDRPAAKAHGTSSERLSDSCHDGSDDEYAGPTCLTLSGVCQLAITPSSHGMGHIVIPANVAGTSSSERLRRPLHLGLAVRPMTSPGASRDPCFDDDTELLGARLTNFDTGASLEGLVARTGGDMCRLAPSTRWLIHKVFGEEAAASDTDSFAEDEEEDVGDGDEEEDGEGPGEEWGTGAECGTIQDAVQGPVDVGYRDQDQDLDEGHEGEDEQEQAGPRVWQGRRGNWSGGQAAAGGPSGRGPGHRPNWHGAARRPRGESLRAQLQRQRAAFELKFEAETLISGAEVMPKLREFARPLLCQGLAVAGGGQESGVGRGGGSDESGGQDSDRGGEDAEAVDAVVCIGQVTLDRLPASFLG